MIPDAYWETSISKKWTLHTDGDREYYWRREFGKDKVFSPDVWEDGVKAVKLEVGAEFESCYAKAQTLCATPATACGRMHGVQRYRNPSRDLEAAAVELGR